MYTVIQNEWCPNNWNTYNEYEIMEYFSFQLIWRGIERMSPFWITMTFYNLPQILLFSALSFSLSCSNKTQPVGNWNQYTVYRTYCIDFWKIYTHHDVMTLAGDKLIFYLALILTEWGIEITFSINRWDFGHMMRSLQL